MIRLLIVEDHPIVRASICTILDRFSQLEVCEEAENGQKALELLDAGLKVDMVLCDIEMPVMDGISFATTASRRFNLPVVMHSINEGADVVNKAYLSGAKGYLVKNLDIDTLVAALDFIYTKPGRYSCGLSPFAIGTSFVPIDAEIRSN